MSTNKTPEWPFDLDQVIRKAGLRKKPLGMEMLAEALTQIGYPTQCRHLPARWCAVEPCRPIGKRSVKYVKEQNQVFLLSHEGHFLGPKLERNYDEILGNFQKTLGIEPDIECDAEIHWMGASVLKPIQTFSTIDNKRVYDDEVNQICRLLRANQAKTLKPLSGEEVFPEPPPLEIKKLVPQKLASYHNEAVTFEHEHISHLVKRAAYEMKKLGHDATVVIDTYRKFENHEGYQRICVGIERPNEETLWLNRDAWFEDENAKLIHHSTTPEKYCALLPEGQAWLDKFVLNLVTPSVIKKRKGLRL